jgi:predicted oxidoreductase
LGIKDIPELAWMDWLSFAEFEPDDEYGKMWAKQFVYGNIDYVYHWLKSKRNSFFSRCALGRKRTFYTWEFCSKVSYDMGNRL